MNSWVSIVICGSLYLGLLNADNNGLKTNICTASPRCPTTSNICKSIQKNLGMFQVTINNATSFSVRWGPVYNITPNEEFRVAVDGVCAADCTFTQCDGQCVCHFHNKDPNTQYTCQLMACLKNSSNSTECKHLSPKLRVLTPPQVPDKLEAKALNNETIEVNWETPSQRLDEVTYSVFLHGKKAPIPCTQAATAGKQSCSFTNLCALTSYKATLLMYTFETEQSISSANVVTFPNAPTKITVDQVGTSWIAAFLTPAPGSEVFNLNYTIKATAASGSEHVCEAAFISAGLGCKIDKLAASTTYTLTATACHNADCSVPSSPFTAITAPEDPQGLSPGAIVGIVLGSILGFLLLVIVIFFIVLQYKSTHGPIEIPGMTAI